MNADQSVLTKCPRIGAEQWACPWDLCECHLKKEAALRTKAYLQEAAKKTTSDMFDYYSGLELDRIDEFLKSEPSD